MKDEFAAGTVIAGKYRLLSRLTEGGMGAVWRAHHEQLDAPVAIKFLHSRVLEMDGALARFEREAKAAAQIRSPYVVVMHDHGIDPESGMPFIVMEQLEGEDLSHRLRRVKRMQPAQVAKMCDEVCKGLQRAHDNGIVHRDLKPANIFLSTADDDMVKLLDFGIAKETGTKRVVDGQTTTTGQVLGSPNYMSPEQARGLTLDARSDLWSLAVIMYKALTGVRLFKGADLGDIIVKICTEPVPKASKLNKQLNPAVDEFFERAFDRDPHGRYQNAEAFSEALQTALEGVPSEAQSENNWDLPPPTSANAFAPAPMVPQPVDPTPPSLGSLGTAGHAAHVRRVDTLPTPEPPRRSWTLLILGIIVAGGIVLMLSDKPGHIDFERAFRVVDDGISAVEDLIEEHSESKPTASAVPVDEQAELKKRVEEAWSVTYTHVRMNDIPMAVESLEKVIELDPDTPAARANTILDLAVRAFQRNDATHSRMKELLMHGMGAHGPDLLFDLMSTREDTQAGKEAKALLTNITLVQRGSKDMQHAYRIHIASPCRKKPYIVGAMREGGARTLRIISELKKTCHGLPCCVDGDKQVEAVETAIQRRQ